MTPFIDWAARTGLDRILWITDLDMTLLEKRANPADPFVTGTLEEDCVKIDAATAGLYIASGRDLDCIDTKIFPGTQFRVSAEYHCMTRFEPGQPANDRVARPRWDVIEDDLNAILRPGMAVRVKPFMRSIHHAAKTPHEKADIMKDVRRVLDSLMAMTGQRMTLVDGGACLDIMPLETDKGIALDDIISHASRRLGHANFIPVYFGDSPGDLPMIAAIRKRGGVFVCVGSHPQIAPLADFTVESPAACRALFTQAGNLGPVAGTILHKRPSKPPAP